MTEPARPAAASRIAAIDVARGVALVAMAVYHFTWDLEFFGYVERGMTAVGGWKLFARCIASSFLFLAGVSLNLAHGKGIRWPGFRRRFAMVAGAAAAISLATWLAVPGGFIFFGILHQIALASLLGLAFLRLPALATLAIAALVIAAPFHLRSAFFDHPAWWWVGLSSVNPRSNDYVPLFPWFGAVLIGIAAAKLATTGGILARLAALRPGSWSRPLAFAGRHSLAVYLIHQPVLIGLVALAAQVAPPVAETVETRFMRQCEAACGNTGDSAFCQRYCGCMLETLAADGLLARVDGGDPDPALRAEVGELAGLCSAEADVEAPEGGFE